jgi:hypothetical protein
MSELTQNDYKDILNFYNMSIPKTKKQRKRKAEKILAEKLCRCIKKVDKNNEKRAIGLCTKSVIHQKGFIRVNFTCKKKQQIKLLKKRKTKKRKI